MLNLFCTADEMKVEGLCDSCRAYQLQRLTGKIPCTEEVSKGPPNKKTRMPSSVASKWLTLSPQVAECSAGPSHSAALFGSLCSLRFCTVTASAPPCARDWLRSTACQTRYGMPAFSAFSFSLDMPTNPQENACGIASPRSTSSPPKLSHTPEAKRWYAIHSCFLCR